MTVKQAMRENKLISTIIGVISASLLGWGIWVSDGVYKVHYQKLPSADVINAQMKNICDIIDVLKKADETFKSEQKQQTDIFEANLKEQRLSFEKDLKEERQMMVNFQKEILLMFIAIQKQIKDK